MQRFLSTASLSILTAIAIVVYSSDNSTPMSQGVAASSSNPLAGLLDEAWFSLEEESSTPISMGYDLGEERGVMGKSDLLALAPYQFLNCDVGLLSHNPLLGQ